MLQVFSVKKGDIQLGFKTLPGASISCLELGGALGRYAVSCALHFSKWWNNILCSKGTVFVETLVIYPTV